jgi:hypothetical protein
MRSLLVLLAFVLGIAGTAFCVEKATASVKGDYLRPYVVGAQGSQTAGRFAWSPRSLMKRQLHFSPSDNTCYTMRSILVTREPGADVTETVGQRTCTPSSRFQMKHSVQQPR